jgi:orotate phosphoribosyltransferase
VPVVSFEPDVERVLSARRGHFVLESGHHGDLWLDLELLCFHPDRVRPLAEELAARLRAYEVELVCGPLVEGAFVGLLVASALGVPFTYSTPRPRPHERSLYPLDYPLPPALAMKVRDKRVAIVNDVINAGSAVRGTFAALIACGARVVAIGTLAVLGEWTSKFVAKERIALTTLTTFPNQIWAPAECALCAAEVPITDETAPTT